MSATSRALRGVAGIRDIETTGLPGQIEPATALTSQKPPKFASLGLKTSLASGINRTEKMTRVGLRTPSKSSPSPVTSFVSRCINSSTFLIIEDDSYGEHPHIYVKIYPNHLLITDTGCNTPRSKKPSLTSLRQYLETHPIRSNNDECLNPDGQKKYIILCTHCHYDHILGITQFLSANPIIIASDFQPSFLLEDLPTHSLCKFLGIQTPEYRITLWAGHLNFLKISGVPFRIQFLHIPGHTPDSLAWYDIDEHHLYVGDTFYERERSIPIPELPGDADQVPDTQAAIIFPEEGGNWIQFMASLDVLHSFVLHKNRGLRRQHSLSYGAVPRVKVSCGHLTYSADAEDMVTEVRALFRRIIAGKVPVTSSSLKRGRIHDFWLEEGSRYSVLAPRHLTEEAREHYSQEK
jgi:glyoxylase-like metal-dependent hydrolase (beta-lactamase superfamily II)